MNGGEREGANQGKGAAEGEVLRGLGRKKTPPFSMSGKKLGGEEIHVRPVITTRGRNKHKQKKKKSAGKVRQNWGSFVASESEKGKRGAKGRFGWSIWQIMVERVFFWTTSSMKRAEAGRQERFAIIRTSKNEREHGGNQKTGASKQPKGTGDRIDENVLGGQHQLVQQKTSKKNTRADEKVAVRPVWGGSVV